MAKKIYLCYCNNDFLSSLKVEQNISRLNYLLSLYGMTMDDLLSTINKMCIRDRYYEKLLVEPKKRGAQALNAANGSRTNAP